MTPLWIVLGGFGLSFVTGVAADPDGPEPGSCLFGLVFGVIISGCGLIGWALA